MDVKIIEMTLFLWNRVDGALVKSPKDPKEQLAVMGWIENHWKVLDKVNVRNLQNGLVSFEVTENHDRYRARNI